MDTNPFQDFLDMATKKIIRWWLLVSLSLGPTLISCANKNVDETADSEGYEESSVAETDSSGGESDTAENSDSDAGFDEETSSDDSSKETIAENSEATPENAETGKDSDFEPVADDDFENLSFDEAGAKTAAGTDESPAATDPAATDTLGGGDTSVLGDSTTAAADAAAASDFGLGTTPSLSDPVEQPKPKVFRASVMPKISQEAFSKQGANLNRYYFLRKGDNPNTVAKLIYGDEGRAEDLTSWNSTAWVPGNLIYYTSANEAGDMQMKSLYEERSLTPKTVSVKRGESISQIALKRLGHINSWKELAVVNSVARPDSLTFGQKLNYYTDLGEAPAPQLAATPPPAVIQPVVPPPAPVVPPPAPVADLKPPVIENKPRLPERKEKNDVNLSKLLKQNLFFITMGLGVGLLLLALVAINRRKRDTGGAGEEFNEDAFAPPRKKRR
jgi:hypothetical protein